MKIARSLIGISFSVTVFVGFAKASLGDNKVNTSTVARRSPMGYNPCNGFFCDMSSQNSTTFRSLAASMVSTGMRDAGYVYFNLDDGWATTRATNGTIGVDSNAFPDGLGQWTAYLTSLGLKAGLYTDRGTATCEGRPGSLGYEAIDASTYAAWGFSFVKEDSCSASEQHGVAQTDYGKMQAAINATGVDTFFSLCGE